MGTIVKKSLGWSIGLSVLLIVAGCLAIAVPQLARNRCECIRGLAARFQRCDPSGVCLAHAHDRRTLVGAAARRSLYFHRCLPADVPVAGLASLTLAIAIYLFAEGVLELILAFVLRPRPGSGWLLFDAVVTLILAVMIWQTWPSSTEWVIGTLVGISMLLQRRLSPDALSGRTHVTSKLA